MAGYQSTARRTGAAPTRNASEAARLWVARCHTSDSFCAWQIGAELANIVAAGLHGAQLVGVADQHSLHTRGCCRGQQLAQIVGARTVPASSTTTTMRRSSRSVSSPNDLSALATSVAGVAAPSRTATSTALPVCATQQHAAGCSGDPVYAQGMTVAAVEALALRTALAQRHEPSGPRSSEPRPSRSARPGTGSDLALPGIEGPTATAHALVNGSSRRRRQTRPRADPTTVRV